MKDKYLPGISDDAWHSLVDEAVAEAKRRAGMTQSYVDTYPMFGEFQKKYAYNPLGFALDCIEWQKGERLTFYQEEILDSIIPRKKIAICGPRGLGKTAICAIIINWFALTRDGEDWKMPTTASSWHQLSKYLWPEVHKWSRRLKWSVIGRPPYDTYKELMMMNLRLRTGEAFAVSYQNSELMEGAHAKKLLVIFDEAKSTPDTIFDSAEGSLTGTGVPGEEAYALAFSTPGAPTGRFYDILSQKEGYEDWAARMVTKDEAIKAGRMTVAWAEQRKRQWGANSALYLNHVEGVFAAQETNGVIPLAWVEEANNRWLDWKDAGFPGMFTGIGADVSGGGSDSDPTVLAECFDLVKIRRLVVLDDLSRTTATMQTADKLSEMLGKFGYGIVCVDAIGVGAGVLHRLIQQRVSAIPFIASAGTKYMDKLGIYGFANWRSAGWWLLRELLDPDTNVGVCLPPDDRLTGELTAPTYKVQNGRYSIESKIELRRRIGRSTDSADAVIHIMIGPMLYKERVEETSEQDVVYQPSAIGPDY